MRRNQRGAVDNMFVALLVVVLAVGGLVAWRIRQADETVNSTASTKENGQREIVGSEDVRQNREGWEAYTNEEFGFAFSYPVEWGSVQYERRALNLAEAEENLPHTIWFADNDGSDALHGVTGNSPVVRVFPDDWSFTPPKATEWNYQRTLKLLRENLEIGFADEVASGDNFLVVYYYTSFDGTVNIEGVKQLPIPQANASSVQYTYKTTVFDESCLVEGTVSGNTQLKATEACFEDGLLGSITESLQGFRAL